MTDRLRVWLMASQSSWQATLNQIIACRCSLPGIEVELTCVSWNRAWPLIVESLKNKALPDVVQIGSSWLSGLMGLGAIQGLNVSEAVERFAPVEDFAPALWARTLHEDQVWAVPWMQDFRLLYYRRDLVEHLPGFEQGLRNWDDLRQMFTPDTPYVFPGLAEPVLVQTAASWIWAGGGDFPGVRTRISEAWEGFNGLKALYHAILNGEVARESALMGAGEANHWFFARGRGAWYISRPVSLDEMDLRYWGDPQAARSKFGVAAIPLGTQSAHSSYLGGSYLVVGRNSRHPERAWDLVAQLSGPDSQRDLMDQLLAWPARVLPVAPEFSPKVDGALVAQAIARGRTEPSVAHWPVYEGVFARRIAQLLSLAWEGHPWDSSEAERLGMIRDFNDVVWVADL